MAQVCVVFSRVSQSIEGSAFAANAVVNSVLRENVAITGSKATIALWNRWDAVLELVHAFGSVLSIGRNSHAVLGKIGTYPKVFSAPCGHCAAAADGTAEYYFGNWARAQVSVEEKVGSWLYAVEFFDAWDETLHKICLTAESDFDSFREWVELNQATSEASAEPSAVPRQGCSATPAAPGEGAQLLRPEAIPALFTRLIETKQPVQAVVGNDSFVQGTDLVPLTMRATGQWIFVSEESNGLHLRTDRLAEVCLQRVHWQDNASNLVLKAFEPEGRLACVFAPPRESDAPGWDAFLEEIARPFIINPNEP